MTIPHPNIINSSYFSIHLPHVLFQPSYKVSVFPSITNLFLLTYNLAVSHSNSLRFLFLLPISCNLNISSPNLLNLSCFSTNNLPVSYQYSINHPDSPPHLINSHSSSLTPKTGQILITSLVSTNFYNAVYCLDSLSRHCTILSES